MEFCQLLHNWQVAVLSGLNLEEFSINSKIGGEKKRSVNFRLQSGKPPAELLNELMVRDLERFATFDVLTIHTLQGSRADIFKLRQYVYVHSTQTHFVKVNFTSDINRS
ncbi:unnamed protein product [Gongylonema pulchrum]|uniref:TRCF domain-containing protein n=1 Tax=Gongylonema pulchrum TaxID=637853 RepID=A0A183DLA8_9BILA|nr:unnamed protein product [Gongylonema pulchrum]